MSAPPAPAPGTTVPILKALQYDKAAKACKHFGAYLAVPNTAAEYMFLRTTYGNYEDIFLGFDQSGVSSGYWEDHSLENMTDIFKKLSTADGWNAETSKALASDADTSLTGRIKPALAKEALLTSDGAWTPSTGFKMLPVLAMKPSGGWYFTTKYQDLPFVCEMTWCREGCNHLEKGPGTLNSANTLKYDASR